MKMETVGIGLVLTLAAAGLTGCASHRTGAALDQAAMEQRGADMQKAGVMSQSDYVRADTLGHSVAQTHTISDADMNWTLTQLKTETNAIARARVFTTLAAIRPMSAAQKAQIVPAITPFLSSSDPLDQAGAQLVQRAVRRVGD